MGSGFYQFWEVLWLLVAVWMLGNWLCCDWVACNCNYFLCWFLGIRYGVERNKCHLTWVFYLYQRKKKKNLGFLNVCEPSTWTQLPSLAGVLVCGSDLCVIHCSSGGTHHWCVMLQMNSLSFGNCPENVLLNCKVEYTIHNGRESTFQMIGFVRWMGFHSLAAHPWWPLPSKQCGSEVGHFLW